LKKKKGMLPAGGITAGLSLGNSHLPQCMVKEDGGAHPDAAPASDVTVPESSTASTKKPADKSGSDSKGVSRAKGSKTAKKSRK
jgi:hypothetical protein